MNPVTTIDLRLDEYIRLLMQTDGISFVVDNFIALREEYYDKRQSSSGHMED